VIEDLTKQGKFTKRIKMTPKKNKRTFSLTKNGCEKKNRAIETSSAHGAKELKHSLAVTLTLTFGLVGLLVNLGGMASAQASQTNAQKAKSKHENTVNVGATNTTNGIPAPNPTPGRSPSPQITETNISKEFGDIWGEKNITIELPNNATSASTSFSVENKGTNSLELIGTKSSCSCLSGVIKTPIVYPGECAFVKAIVKLPPEGGVLTKTLTVLTVFTDEKDKKILPKSTELTLNIKRPERWQITPKELTFQDETPQTLTTQTEIESISVGDPTLLGPGFEIKKISSQGTSTTYSIKPSHETKTAKTSLRFSIAVGESRIPAYVQLTKTEPTKQ
jgi:hypothetical protein